MASIEDPQQIKQRAAELQREIASLKAEIKRQGDSGQDVAQLAEKLDEAEREYGFLSFYVDDEPAKPWSPRARPAPRLGSVQFGAAEISPQGTKPTGGRAIALVIGIALVVLAVAGGAMSFFVMSEPEQARIEPATAVKVETAKPPRAAGREVLRKLRDKARRRLAKRSPATASPEPAPAPPEPEAEPRRVRVLWQAKVKAATGALSLPVGTQCTITSEMERSGKGTLKSRPIVTCGAKTLFRWDTPLKPATGQRESRFRVWEGFTLERLTYRYWLKHTDLGTRAEPPQLDIDTKARKAVVWRDEAPAFRVELEVDRYGRYQGKPLFPERDPHDPGFSKPVKKFGRALTATGRASAIQGKPCSVTISPYWSQRHTCRVEVRCANQLWYGREGFGYNKCTVENGVPVRAHDKSASDDPIFKLDMPAKQVLVEDDRPQHAFSIRILLSS